MILYSKWLELSLSTRAKIAEIFGIEKKAPTHVENNRVVSDGYLIKDIETALNVEALQKYLESNETDLAKLFFILVETIENRLVKPIPNPVIPPEVVPQIQEVIKKRGRPKLKK